MNDVTRILSSIERGEPGAAEQLLPMVYEELRKLAAQRLAHEMRGQTLQATALVHEAYIRLVCSDGGDHWQGRGRFFAAAAEAMRRILIEQARREKRLKRGGDLRRVGLDQATEKTEVADDRLLDLVEALDKLEVEDPEAAQIVKLRYFAGLSITDAAEVLGVSRAKAYDQWSYARAWLRCEVEDGDMDQGSGRFSSESVDLLGRDGALLPG